MNNSNKYGSLRNTFVGPDLFNLPLPVLPPADLSLTAAQFAPVYMHFRSGGGANAETEIVGFSPRDKPYIRGLAMMSNLADGLVDSCSSHVNTGNSWRLRFSLQRFAAKLTGTISNTAGSATVGGTSTLFSQELAVGLTLVWLDDNGVVRSGVISTIASDTSLALTALTTSTAGTMFTANTTLKGAYSLAGAVGVAGSSIDVPFLALNNLEPFAFFLGSVAGVTPPQGRITMAGGSVNVVGVGTSFTTDFTTSSIIAWLDDAGVRRTGCVATVTDDTHMTLTTTTSMTGTPYLSATNVAMIDTDNHLRIKAQVFDIFEAYTVSIDPAYGDGTRRLGIHAMAEIEHTFPMTAAAS